MKVSEICGRIIKSASGKTGYVISVNEFAGKPCCLVCADENEREFTVDIKDVSMERGEMIYADRAYLAKHSVPIRLGKPVYDTEGKFLGTLTDYTFQPQKEGFACVGRKKYPAADVANGDVMIVRRYTPTLKSDVEKDGKVIFRKGTHVTEEVLEAARAEGEYVQTNLKTLK